MLNYYTKDDTATNYYNKTNIDEKVATLNTSIDTKANSSNVYTKAQTDAALLLKANVADVYTKTASDAALTLKANAADVYTKTDADARYRLISESYTKTDITTNYYTKANVDAL
jgi:hypothetical protein